MSHNVLLHGVVFRDLDILQAAVAELVQEGVHAVVIKQPTKIRGWNGRGAMVDAAIMLEREQYDIGLKKQADGSYIPFMESMLNAAGIQAQPNACSIDSKQRHDYMAAKLGRLTQRYAVIHAERQARKLPNVMSVKRAVKTNGQIHLNITYK